MKEIDMLYAVTGKDKTKFVLMLESMMDTLEDTIWMLKTSEQYDDNEIYDKLENLKCYCKSIGLDSRDTKTLMKDLGI